MTLRHLLASTALAAASVAAVVGTATPAHAAPTGAVTVTDPMGDSNTVGDIRSVALDVGPRNMTIVFAVKDPITGVDANGFRLQYVADVAVYGANNRPLGSYLVKARHQAGSVLRVPATGASSLAPASCGNIQTASNQVADTFKVVVPLACLPWTPATATLTGYTNGTNAAGAGGGPYDATKKSPRFTFRVR